MLIYADNVALNRYKQKDLIHITICRRMGSTDAGHFYTILQLDLYKSLRKLPTLRPALCYLEQHYHIYMYKTKSASTTVGMLNVNL